MERYLCYIVLIILSTGCIGENPYEKEVSDCEKIADEKERDNCFTELFLKNEDPLICETIKDTDYIIFFRRTN